ncbi:hypothetical protein TELCIR_07179 [Teladorsagia circumcincta]|uniref:Uncharacterized protein n=1 Tax=Teladorsagia circumcincta TaxID=45464 RepID=A0A2G9UL16_TELCI|nr:hypothetical protein TELCIR_07179 [Teladorsagia circumcincta]
MLSLVDYRNDEQARLNLLSLAVEQKDPQILYELTCPQLLNCTSTSASYWIAVSKNLPTLICVLPVFRTKAVLNGLLKFAMQCADYGNQILCDIKACKENQVGVSSSPFIEREICVGNLVLLTF